MRIHIITESLYLIFQIPILLLAPENENCFGSKHLTKWAGCWLYHFPIDSNLLDHQYPVVLAYNGINHYVSTYILDQKSKNCAILKLMKSMTANISQVSEDLAGRGATNVKLYFDQLQVQINNAITSGDLTKFTPASSLTSGLGAPSSQPPSSQAHPPAEKRYKCDQCEQSFSRSNELQNHKVSKHGSGFSCNLCDHEPFQSAAALKLHQTKAHGQGTAKMYKCDVCQYSSNRADALKAHKIKQHGLIIPDEEMVPCINAPECKQKFITQENMRQHYRLICQKQATVTCPHPGCDRTFKNQTQMKSHFKSHTAEKKEWYCSQCKKQFSSKQSYNQHMTRHN